MSLLDQDLAPVEVVGKKRVSWVLFGLLVLIAALTITATRGASALGRFLSAFLAGFWLLRIFLQWFYYDSEVRRANRLLDSLYIVALLLLVGIFGWATFRPAV